MAHSSPYLIAAWRCGVLVYAMYCSNFVSTREFVAWSLMTVLFIFLGINKQLDLQSAVTEVGRVLFYRPDRIAYKRENPARFHRVRVNIGGAGDNRYGFANMENPTPAPG